MIDPPRDAPVSLREVTRDTVRDICDLATTAEQTRFVAPNAVSIAQAHFADYAWFRAIYAGETPVGFLMISDKPDVPEYFLWRFMIDARHQGRGYGAQAIRLLLDHVRTRPRATELFTSVVPGPGTPQPFYESLGFVDTGRVEDDEKVLRIEL
jgi:diamine N-acetyltransferase